MPKKSRLIVETVNGQAFINFCAFLVYPNEKSRQSKMAAELAAKKNFDSKEKVSKKDPA